MFGLALIALLVGQGLLCLGRIVPSSQLTMAAFHRAPGLSAVLFDIWHQPLFIIAHRADEVTVYIGALSQ